MKKILLIIVLFIPLIINATSINKIYVDSELDIAGNLLVKEIIEVNNYESDFNVDLFYKDENLKDFDGTIDSFYNSNIYNAYDINILNIGLINDEYNIDDIYDEDFIKNNVTLINNYETNDENGYLNIKFNNESKIYYLEYNVMALAVKHNDCAEMYYKYFDLFNYDVNEINIVLSLPFNSSLFEVYSHGNKNISVKKDINDSIVVINVNNYKKNSLVELRIVYDKDIFAIAINNSKKSNIDALDYIKSVEKNRMNNTNIKKVIYYVLISLVLVIVISIILFIIYKHTRKKMNHKKKH